MKNPAKSSVFVGIIFAVLFAFPLRAETPFVIDSAWGIQNMTLLSQLASTGFGNYADLCWTLPEEVVSQMIGATVTDGRGIWTIIILKMKNPQFSLDSCKSDFKFRLQLRYNAIIAAAFPKCTFQMFQKGSDLYLVSPGLSEADIDTINLFDHYLDVLAETEATLFFTQNYPERTLLPTLPPEQEDESAFIKRVRKRSGKNYKDGQYADTVDSIFYGVGTTEDALHLKYEYEQVNAQTSSDAETSPFAFSGFVNPDAPVSTAFRYPVSKEAIEKGVFVARFGTQVIPPEERTEDEHKFETNFNFAFFFDEQEEIPGYTMIAEEGIALHYLEQPANRPEEEGVPSSAELEKADETLVRSLLPFITNVRQSFLSADWSKPTDLAISYENECLFAACSCRPGTTVINWNLAKQFWQIFNDYFLQLKPDMEPNDMCMWGITLGESKEEAGISWHRILMGNKESGMIFVYGYESETFYAALGFLAEAKQEVDEQYDMLQRQLVQKVNDSRQGIADKKKAPTTVFHSHFDGYEVRWDYEPAGRAHKHNIEVKNDSVANVVEFLKQWNFDLDGFFASDRCDEHYIFGEGDVQDRVAELNWMRQQAEEGDAEWQATLGLCYSRGDGVSADAVDAVDWYTVAG
ncbi:MAG: hypothetical protein LBI05_01555 [Planctomycetaceae bacterium]|nr:hypothetical protein [Planctomycetaceae bacterium]